MKARAWRGMADGHILPRARIECDHALGLQADAVNRSAVAGHDQDLLRDRASIVRGLNEEIAATAFYPPNALVRRLVSLRQIKTGAWRLQPIWPFTSGSKAGAAVCTPTRPAVRSMVSATVQAAQSGLTLN